MTAPLHDVDRSVVVSQRSQTVRNSLDHLQGQLPTRIAQGAGFDFTQSSDLGVAVTPVLVVDIARARVTPVRSEGQRLASNSKLRFLTVFTDPYGIIPTDAPIRTEGLA